MGVAGPTPGWQVIGRFDLTAHQARGSLNVQDAVGASEASNVSQKKTSTAPLKECAKHASDDGHFEVFEFSASGLHHHLAS